MLNTARKDEQTDITDPNTRLESLLAVQIPDGMEMPNNSQHSWATCGERKGSGVVDQLTQGQWSSLPCGEFSLVAV